MGGGKGLGDYHITVTVRWHIRPAYRPSNVLSEGSVEK